MAIKKIICLLLSCFFCCSCNTKTASNDSNKMDSTVSIEGFEKDDDSFLTKINNGVETFSFINKVNVPNNYTWSLYYDFEGTNEIITKTIKCELGDNFVYLLVYNSSNTIGFYTINVYRYHMYNVTFDTDGGTPISPQQVQEESLVAPVNNPQKTGYSFSGWDYDFTQPVLKDLCIKALWNANKYLITLDPQGGIVSSTSIEVYYNQYVTLPTPSKTGSTFLGWYKGNNKISNGYWTYLENMTLTAKWEISIYIITYDPNGGILNGEQTQSVRYGDTFTLATVNRDGYDFLGWFDGNNVFNSGSWTYEENKMLIAHWSPKEYTVNFNPNGGICEIESLKIKYDSTYELPIPEFQYYNFTGWYNESTLIPNSGIWKYESMTLVAHWSPNLYSLSITSESNYHGNVSVLYGEGYFGETITVSASPIDYYDFDGWYNGSTKVSEDETFSFLMPHSNYSLIAKFSVNTERWQQMHGITPSIDTAAKTIEYGLYPQTHVSDSYIINELNSLSAPSLNDWYFYDNEYYSKSIAEPSNPYYVFDNGDQIISGETYWFKCEPIFWNILSGNSSDYFLISSVLLDSRFFHSSTSSRTIEGVTVNPNNYIHSDIRNWLNDVFYNSAFYFNNSHILTSTIGNFAYNNVGSKTATYDNSSEKVFLASYEDFKNTNYGFPSTGSGDGISSRKCTLSDYTKAKEIYANISVDYENCGFYWTRTSTNTSTNTWLITPSGSFMGPVVTDKAGIRPAIHFRKS